MSFYGGAGTEPAGATAEGGIKYNRADSLTGTTPIPRPTSAGTNNSFVKQLALEVTASDATAISNRTIRFNGALATGLGLFFLGHATYLDQTGGTGAPADHATLDGQTPSGYAAVTSSAQGYHSNSASAGSTGRNGNFCRTVATVSNNYAGGAGSAITLTDVILGYDEA